MFFFMSSSDMFSEGMIVINIVHTMYSLSSGESSLLALLVEFV